MNCIRLIKHAPGSPGLRLLGLGPNLLPCKGVLKLRKLLDKHAFWAQGRSNKKLRQLLARSSVVVSLWRGTRMVGFGRATSDGTYRAVLWDIVVADDLQGMGLGRQVVDALLSAAIVKDVEKIYLMTTKSSEFYVQLGFEPCQGQSLLCINASHEKPNNDQRHTQQTLAQRQRRRDEEKEEKKEELVGWRHLQHVWANCRNRDPHW